MTPPQLINLSPDLKKLWDDGLELELKNDFLLVHKVPYVNSSKTIARGILVSEIARVGERTGKPSTHQAYFIGDHPCNADGSILIPIKNASGAKQLADGLTINHTFSNKLEAAYTDYHQKITNYLNLIWQPAQQLDISVTPYTYEVRESAPSSSPHVYTDANATNAEICCITDKVRNQTVAIVGLGGTGAYILDLVAKTTVKEIRLFDPDDLLLNNAFRAPGAVPMETLLQRIKKTDYYKEVYSRMHRNIVSNPVKIDSETMGMLSGADFVFIAIDQGSSKEPIVTRLIELKIPFIDVGMGILRVEGIESLTGLIRTTTVTPRKHDHVNDRISFADNKRDEYDRNIQIAELNALNAAFAVIRWKKLFGVYSGIGEHNSDYSLYSADIANDEIAT